jgi:hypothetical protein
VLFFYSMFHDAQRTHGKYVGKKKHVFIMTFHDC